MAQGRALRAGFGFLLLSFCGVTLLFGSPASALPWRPQLVWGQIPQVQTTLAPLPLAELKKARDYNAAQGGRRYQIGIGRPLEHHLVIDRNAAPAQEWRALPRGGLAYSAGISSPGAFGLRVHLQNVQLPPGAQIVIYDPNNPAIEPILIQSGEAQKESDFWTATLLSDHAVVEADLPPGADPNLASVTVSEVSHIYDIPIPSNLKEGTCHKDVSCYSSFAQEASGVARISFVESGNVYLCSGCLLATATGSSENYFLTANHCVPKQAVASTVELYWFFQTSSCNGSAPTLAGVPHTSGGADLLATGTASDFTFLKLRQSPPAGTYHLPWSTSQPNASETLTCIHHPDGAYKRICFGKFYDSDEDYIAVRWNSGVTEPGSSGGPLLNGSHQVIGQLNGGWDGPGSSCGSPSSPDQFGRFDVSYLKIQHWLGGSGGSGEFTPVNGTYTGLFYDPTTQISPETSGLLTATVSSKGTVSGKLQTAVRTFSFHGQFEGDGTVNISLFGGLLGVITLRIQVDLSDPDSMTGTISGSGFTAQLNAFRNVFDGRSVVAPQAGQYTLSIPGDHSADSQPGGDSYGTLSITTKGSLRFTGSLSDGVKVSQSTFISSSGLWPLFVPLYGGKGVLLGWVNIGEDLNGNISWIKDPNSKSKAYLSGFIFQRSIVGGRYRRPPIGVNVLNNQTANVYVSGADLSDTLVEQVAIAANNGVKNLGPDQLKLSFSSTTGTFKGSVVNPNTRRALSFSGVVLQNQNIATGYFLSAGQSGLVSVEP